MRAIQIWAPTSHRRLNFLIIQRDDHDASAKKTLKVWFMIWTYSDDMKKKKISKLMRILGLGVSVRGRNRDIFIPKVIVRVHVTNCCGRVVASREISLSLPPSTHKEGFIIRQSPSQWHKTLPSDSQVINLGFRNSNPAAPLEHIWLTRAWWIYNANVVKRPIPKKKWRKKIYQQALPSASHIRRTICFYSVAVDCVFLFSSFRQFLSFLLCPLSMRWRIIEVGSY